jgi:hypothetical protein
MWRLRGGGAKLKTAIWDAAKSTIEQWTWHGAQADFSIRNLAYSTDGAILNPHVDRLPFVSSCIVNVAQDVDEPWPLEIYDREGNAVNVTMEPGDMVCTKAILFVSTGDHFLSRDGTSPTSSFTFSQQAGKLSHHSDDYVDVVDDFFLPTSFRIVPKLRIRKVESAWMANAFTVSSRC